MVSELNCGLTGCRVASDSHLEIYHDPPPPPPKWSTHGLESKGLGMSSRVCATGHIKDPMPLLTNSRASCRGGRFPLSFIYQ